MLRTCRVKSVPYGLAGGKDGTPFAARLRSGEAETQLPHEMLIDTEVRSGETLLHVQPGAGGYGDPLVRDPQLVLDDVLDEKISPAYAEREYGVAIDEGTEQVDWQRTAQLRATLQADLGG